MCIKSTSNVHCKYIVTKSIQTAILIRQKTSVTYFVHKRSFPNIKTHGVSLCYTKWHVKQKGVNYC